ncbi:hypothetical protein DV072_10020, partial [Neisseria gonorrhoeae]
MTAERFLFFPINAAISNPVIPAQAGIQCVEFQLFRINFETLIPSFPRKWESRSVGTETYR